ncbi:phosphate ABC transporter permease PstA [Maritalea myrionectae]|uniref:phosphate ABC transporter permease PstA n=1 Tax=Maritalea myrionectae TaxID=454601 RepID=UPI0003FE6E17
MTDLTGGNVEKASIHTSDDARSRLAKRYRGESLFKWLGRSAIGVSVAFLLLLLSTVVFQGMPAFTFNFVNLPFELTKEKLDTDGSYDSLRKANYDAVVRDAIRDQFPSVTGRSEKRALSGLLSSGAPVYLRQQVLDDPSVLGSDKRLEIPISDFADLYLKGQITNDSIIEGNGALQVDRNDKGLRLIADEPVFADALARAKEALKNQAASMRDQQSGLQLSLNKTRGDIEALQGRIPAETNANVKSRLEAELERSQSDISVLEARIKQLEEQTNAIESRVANPGLGEKLTGEMLSVLVYANDAVLKVEQVTSTTANVVEYMPLNEATTSIAANQWNIRVLEVPEANRKFTDQEIVWTDELVERGYVRSGLNTIFFTRGASREPEMAGVLGAAVGSALTLIVTLLLSFPLGVAAAIYLEEFAPKNRWTTLIEVNINNLAAVPSIVFGLLGLAVFLNYFELDRSAPYVGGMVLALMTLPTIIIASRAALRAVPPSIREAALGIGASRLQTVLHHVLPLAMPGILTGTIIGMAQALGETAPLLMIGMVAFVVDIPMGFSDPSTVLPVQIFMWADFPEPAFQQRTSAAIMVLLGFLIAMNALAVVLRKRFERRW